MFLIFLLCIASFHKYFILQSDTRCLQLPAYLINTLRTTVAMSVNCYPFPIVRVGDNGGAALWSSLNRSCAGVSFELADRGPAGRALSYFH